MVHRHVEIYPVIYGDGQLPAEMVKDTEGLQKKENNNMNLLDLPADVLLIILNMLDSYDKYNVYYTCYKLRNFICTSAVSKSHRFSLCPLASGDILRDPFVINISGHIQELNLCAVLHLTKSALVPSLKRMPNLKSLNVSYTNIVIPDLLDVVAKCNLKAIAINFVFNKKSELRISDTLLSQCQEIFKDVENVHFVGIRENLIFSPLPLCVLKNATSLINVIFTVVNKFDHVAYVLDNEYSGYEQLFQFTKFSIFVNEWRYDDSVNANLNFSPIFQLLDTKCNKQFVIVTAAKVIVSSKLIHYFTDNFNNSQQKFQLGQKFSELLFCDNTSVLIWNSDRIITNKLFFENEFKEIKKFIPHSISCRENVNVTAQHYGNYFQVDYYTQMDDSVNVSHGKRLKRIAPSTIPLHFDNLFKKHNKVKFVLNFFGPPLEVKLYPDSEYLKKITMWRLHGFVKYSNDFFKTLFKKCINLTTFCISYLRSPACVINLLKGVPFSQTLKNFMLREDKIPYSMLFESLSKCQNIESVSIIEVGLESELEKPAKILKSIHKFIAKSRKFYNLYICAPLSDGIRVKIYRELQKYKQDLNKNYLNVEIYANRSVYKGASYDPFINVYDLAPMKHL